MARTSLLVITAFCLIFPSLCVAGDKDIKDLKSVKDDIQIINLLNSLDLKRDQMEFIIKEAKKVEFIQKAALDKISSYKLQMAEVQNTIKGEVETGKVVIDKNTAVEFRKLKEENENIMLDTCSRINEHAATVEGKLEQYQLLALDGYKPCIIPIMKQGKIGQADKSEAISKILEKIKQAPDIKYQQQKDIFAQKILEKLKLKMRALQMDEQAMKAKIFEAFGEARKMEAVDFQLKKSALAEKLYDDLVPKQRGMDRPEKIKKFLLSDRVIPILEERLKGQRQ